MGFADLDLAISENTDLEYFKKEHFEPDLLDGSYKLSFESDNILPSLIFYMDTCVDWIREIFIKLERNGKLKVQRSSGDHSCIYQ